MPCRRTALFWLFALLLAAPLVASGPAAAAIEPPWCGTPTPDAAANLPTTGPGAFPHIPYYAIGCTLDSIAARSGGRMTVERHGVSALGREMYRVTINELRTRQQRRGYANWEKIRRVALHDPEKAQKILDRVGSEVKVPLFVQGGIHGNEYEGVDAAMQIIERLALTPYGSDPEVDRILDNAVVVFNPIQNPDGRVAGTRANGNGFDLNRDFLTQSQSETQATVATMHRWLAPDMLDLHGYVEPTLIEATTKPHNPGIEYDFWLKWNQSRIDANEAAMNAEEFLVTRPINDWCADGSESPDPVTGLCADGTTRWGPRWAESWDDWGPFYTPMYSQLLALNASTVEMCNATAPFGTGSPPRTICGPRVSDNAKIGRLGARRAQYIVTWSTLLYDVANRGDLLHDQLEIYRRGVADAARPPLSSFPPAFQNEENYWMHEYPQAYVIPMGDGQRSDVEARRLVAWLLANGIEVERLQKDYDHGGMHFERGSLVVHMNQPLRGLADTSLGPGVDVSDRIGVLYAPPAAWSHGYLWGADVVQIPDSPAFRPKTNRLSHLPTVDGGIAGGRSDSASAYALELDSPTAVRTLNALLHRGLTAELATAPFSNELGQQLPAGTVLFPAASRDALEAAGRDAGVWFSAVAGTLPAREPIERSPRIAVLANALTQEIWVLRNLGFPADPISTAALNSAAGPDPLASYDAIYNIGGLPGAANATYRARIAAFLSAGGGYIGGGAGGANFLGANGVAQVAGLTAAIRNPRGWSGIIRWANLSPGTGQITGAYPSEDNAIVDPPTWFTSVPADWTVDARLPLAGFFLAGLWKFDAPSASAPGAAVIAHGTNTARTARITSFAMNPAYRADPEREWPMLASAAYWVDQ